MGLERPKPIKPKKAHKMDENAFINAVAEMRECQKNYFATRLPLYLKRSKEWEKRVDNWLEKHYAKRRQNTLFSELKKDAK